MEKKRSEKKDGSEVEGGRVGRDDKRGGVGGRRRDENEKR